MTAGRQLKQFEDAGGASGQRWEYDGNLWIPFGTYAYMEDENDQSTGSGIYVEGVSLTTPSLLAGDYEIGYQCAVRSTVEGFYTEVRVQVDDDPDDLDMALTPHRWAQQDTSLNQRIQVSGSRRMTLDAGVHNIDLDFRSESNAATSFLYKPALYIIDAPDTSAGGAIPQDNRYQLKQVDVSGALPDDQVWWDGSKWIAARYFQHEESLARSTQGLGFAQKLRMTTTAGMPAGTYLLYWHWTWDRSTTSGDAGFRIQLDDTTDIRTWEIEPQDASTNQTNIISGFREQTLTAGVHTFDVDFQNVSGGQTVGIKDTFLTLLQVGV